MNMLEMCSDRKINKENKETLKKETKNSPSVKIDVYLELVGNKIIFWPTDQMPF